MMECLIIAAGQGSRLRTKGSVKPLVPLLGVPLIERVIRSAAEGGIDRFWVVTGYQGEKVAEFLQQLAPRLGVTIGILQNDDWQKENGLSVLRARDKVVEPFLLLMADHLVDPAMIRSLRKQHVREGEVLLAVDPDLENPRVDLKDVTKVRIEDGTIVDIGKTLHDYDGYDTGLFLCTRAIFDALEQAYETGNDSTLTAALRILAADGRARAVRARGLWVDVDDEKAYTKAEELLLDALRGKRNDGPVSRWLNRPISVRLSRRIVGTRLTPNQISLFSFVLSMVAAGFLTLQSSLGLAVGGIVAQVASIVDGCDGEVARLKYMSSAYGGWLDAVLDRYADSFLLFGLTWHAFGLDHSPWALGVGFLAIIGSLMVSYTADKYDQLMRSSIGSSRGVRIGRDSRIFLIFLGAVFNQAYAVLVVIAVLMNLEALRRIIVCRSPSVA